MNKSSSKQEKWGQKILPQISVTLAAVADLTKVRTSGIGDWAGGNFYQLRSRPSADFYPAKGLSIRPCW